MIRRRVPKTGRVAGASGTCGGSGGGVAQSAGGRQRNRGWLRFANKKQTSNILNLLTLRIRRFRLGGPAGGRCGTRNDGRIVQRQWGAERLPGGNSGLTYL